MRACSVGLDFGTNSVRAIVVDCADGQLLGSAVSGYPSGDHGVLLDAADPHLARQNPADYAVGLEAAVREALAAARMGHDLPADGVIGIGVDATASTPLPVDEENRPLALDPAWRDRLAAHAWLWKDHTATEEAVEITETARAHAPEYVAPIGGTYSPEWFWSKIWRCRNVAPDVFDAAASWVELCDYVPSLLAGVTRPADIARSVCAAGHKGLYSESWGGLPDDAFLSRLDPALAALRARLYERAYPADRPAGHLSAAWAERLGLRQGLPIAMGIIDAHAGAIGAGVRTGTLVKIIGTSTCDIAIGPPGVAIDDVPGISGIVNGSVIPGCYGLEGGQAAVGDLLRWWVERVCEGDATLHDVLTSEAARLAPGQSGLLALDWNNGNRNVLMDQRLTGLLVGQTLHTSRAEIYRALIEATAFGARVIIERLREHGVPIERVVCCGGIAEKNPLFLQVYADVIGQPMLLAGSAQAPALGAAIAAAVAAGADAGGYDRFEAAQERMTSPETERFTPDPAAHGAYDELFALYRELHDAFGGVAGAPSDLGSVMKRLLAIRAGSVTRVRYPG